MRVLPPLRPIPWVSSAAPPPKIFVKPCATFYEGMGIPSSKPPPLLTMRDVILFVAVAGAILLGFAVKSCQEDDEPAPAAAILEVAPR